MKFKLYIAPLAAILLCLGFAVFVHFSYSDANSQIYDYNYVGGGTMSDLFKTNKISSADDIIEQSDLIVKAEFAGTREITADAFYSTVKVRKVYKGDKALAETNLCIIEPLSIFPKNKFINASTAFLIPMQSGDEYILLLKHMQFDSERKLNNLQETQYYPVTEGSFGCYRLSDKSQTTPMQKDETYTINILKNFDIFTDDTNVLSTYNQYKQQIFKKIGLDSGH